MESSWTADPWLLKCSSVHILLMSQSFDSVGEKAMIFVPVQLELKVLCIPRAA